jgi:hypothetical protein
VEKCGYGIFQSIAPEFGWGDRGKVENISVGMAEM